MTPPRTRRQEFASPALTGTVIITAPGIGRIGIETPVRRRQSIALFFISLYFVMPMTMFCWFVAFYSVCMMLTSIGPFVAFYLSYAYLLDNSQIAGTRWAFLRNLNLWEHACDYFPALLVKTAELDPTKNYIMGYHPHGIISCGAMCAFATEGCQTLSLTGSSCSTSITSKDKDNSSGRGFSALFPGIERRLITLPQNFVTPFLREYLLSMGCCDSSRNTFRQNLNAEGGGRAVVVVVGGAAESMLVKPGQIDLVLSKRTGFVREAILAGASLVPCIAFGETDLYETFDVEDHWVARFQAMVKKVTGVAMPIFKGRSILFRDFGLMPVRRPIVVVVGSPIDPPKLDDERRKNFKPKFDRATSRPLDDDAELVLAMHKKYVESLQKLYSAHKESAWNVPGQLRSGSLKIK